MLEAIEQTRLRVSKNTEAKRKSELGQFLTPAKTAHFMAGLFTSKSSLECRLLDAGAGIGSLSSAFLDRCISGELRFKTIEVTAYELDSLCLRCVLCHCRIGRLHFYNQVWQVHIQDRKGR